MNHKKIFLILIPFVLFSFFFTENVNAQTKICKENCYNLGCGDQVVWCTFGLCAWGCGLPFNCEVRSGCPSFKQTHVCFRTDCPTGNSYDCRCDSSCSGAECGSDADCSSKCIDDTRYYSGSCLSSDCKCSYSTEDCDAYDWCYTYGNGCEERDYYCSNGACLNTTSNRHTDSSCNFTGCSGDACSKTGTFKDYACEGGTCNFLTKSCSEACPADKHCSAGVCVAGSCSGTTTTTTSTTTSTTSTTTTTTITTTSTTTSTTSTTTTIGSCPAGTCSDLPDIGKSETCGITTYYCCYLDGYFNWQVGRCTCTSCGPWHNVSCGAYPCDSNQMKKTRTCTPSGCDLACSGSPLKCTFSYECEYALDCDCSCKNWKDVGCGVSPCDSTQFKRVGSCSGPGCTPESSYECLDDWSAWNYFPPIDPREEEPQCGNSCGTAGTCAVSQTCFARSKVGGCEPDQYKCMCKCLNNDCYGFAPGERGRCSAGSACDKNCNCVASASINPKFEKIFVDTKDKTLEVFVFVKNRGNLAEREYVDLSHVIQPADLSMLVNLSPTHLLPTSSSLMTITAKNIVAGGSYIITAKGRSESGIERSDNFTLSIPTVGMKYDLSVNPTNGKIRKGQSVRANVNLIFIGGTRVRTLLSATAKTNKLSFSFQNDNVLPPGSTVLTIKAAEDIAEGDYEITITAKVGNSEKTAKYSLTILPSLIFNVSINPENGRAVPGETKTTDVKVSYVSGLEEPIQLAAYAVNILTGRAEGTISLSFSKDYVNPKKGFSETSTLTIKTSDLTPASEYAVSIKAQGTGHKEEATYYLTVIISACSKNEQCNDSNPCTEDACKNPGKVDAFCSYSNQSKGYVPPDNGCGTFTGDCIGKCENSKEYRNAINAQETCSKSCNGLGSCENCIPDCRYNSVKNCSYVCENNLNCSAGIYCEPATAKCKVCELIGTCGDVTVSFLGQCYQKGKAPGVLKSGTCNCLSLDVNDAVVVSDCSYCNTTANGLEPNCADSNSGCEGFDNFDGGCSLSKCQQNDTCTYR